MSKKSQRIILGELPIDLIEKTIGIDDNIHEGEVVLTKGAKKHIEDKHLVDYERYGRLLPDIIAHPTFLGDDFRNKNKIEFIKKVSGGDNILVAVSLELNNGYYHVASFYCISQEKIDNRIMKKTIKRVVFSE